MNEVIEISKLIDRYLPAEGVGTEREQIRMEMHNDISMLVKNLTIPHVINSAEYTRGYRDGWRDCCKDVKEFG